jgi:integrase
MLRADMEAADILPEDEAGRPRNFHSLRHTFCSNLARAGVHPSQAMQLMRHSKIELTMKRYTHTFLPERAQALASLPDLDTTNRQTVSEVA